MRIKHIALVITLEDDEEVHGALGPEVDARWGNDIEHLGACVEPMKAIDEALVDGAHYFDDEEEE